MGDWAGMAQNRTKTGVKLYIVGGGLPPLLLVFHIKYIINSLAMIYIK